MEQNQQILKEFQLSNNSIAKKSEDNTGLDLAKYIVSTVNGGIRGYYFARNSRFKQNRNSANGKINLKKFQDLMEFNGKTNYANINWQSIRIVNRIVSGLVGRWMNRNEKIVVNATDSLSVKQKQDEYENIEFIMDNRAMLEQLQAESGVQMIPQNTSIPADKEELNLWVTQFQRLPEEIKYEMGTNEVLDSCSWFTVMKEKMLHDSADVGFVGTYTWMEEYVVIHVEWVKPENAFYSYSEFPVFRDTTFRGRVRAMKISELRKKYGKQFGGKLTEEDLFRIAATAKEYQLGDKITWLDQWAAIYTRPYDEWNVDIYEFEIKTVDSEPYTVVTTKKNKSTIVKKGVSEKRGDNEKAEEDRMWNIYRGVYVKDTDYMLEWGLKQNMIRPQDPKEVGNAEFSYSFYMYQSYEMRNIAVPEKIEEPADQMILARLKIQQLVAKMKPVGAAINVTALQNIDYGLGDKNKTIDYKQLYEQVGDLYYNGTDAEGNPVPVPITELANAGFLPQMQALMELYRFHYQVLRDELGEDPNLAASALQPRVTQGNVATSQDVAANATDYMYLAYAECMKDTARKISCLLKDSVTHGADVYRRLINQEEVASRIFNTNVRFLPDGQEIMKFEALLNQAMVSTPELVLFIDPFQLIRVAKEDVKLAETLYRQGQRKMLKSQQETAAQNQKATIEGQIASAQAAEKSKQETESVKGDIELQKTKTTGEYQNKNTVLASIMKIYEQGLPMPVELQALAQAVIQNVALPASIQNEQIQQQVLEQMQQQQMQQEQQQGQQEGQEQMQEQQPQEGMEQEQMQEQQQVM